MQEHIHVYKCIPEELCDTILDYSKTIQWSPHCWTDGYGKHVRLNNPKELEVHHLQSNFYQDELKKCCISALQQYWSSYEYLEDILSSLAYIRLNRYSPGQVMLPHVDDIRSLFPGDKPGVPLVSLVGLLNDDYQGGELTFHFPEQYSLKPAKGSIVIFPSTYLYPHSVSEVTQGVRHSFVSWGW